MIIIKENETLVYRVLKIKGLPYPVTVIRDPSKEGGFTAFMEDYPYVLSDEQKLKDCIKGLKNCYSEAKKFLSRKK